MVQEHAKGRPVKATGATEKRRHGHERHVQEIGHRLIDTRPASIVTRVCPSCLCVYLYLSYIKHKFNKCIINFIYVHAASVAERKLFGFDTIRLSISAIIIIDKLTRFRFTQTGDRYFFLFLVDPYAYYKLNGFFSLLLYDVRCLRQKYIHVIFRVKQNC